ncbi:hypothetical protein [Haloactinomyces albus]|uniref:Uncharacterized protein n=1 Tax=Haloactinomyces albus TaxID=1352928 RepID=A0AAE4CQ98_9ACTN|nr:hypothetical protein [Haloactinomyces albus]MDR7302458.1 hypothetical protein [Haloactinomyces albus]
MELEALRSSSRKMGNAIDDISATLMSTANDTESNDQQSSDGFSGLRRQV